MPTRTAEGRPLPVRVDAPERLRRWCDRIRAAGLSLGLVPTMGALHAGHRQLIQRARAECDRTVVSIFVNPTQFGPGEDFDRYPRALDADLAVCAELGVDLAYVPSAAAMYPEGFATRVSLRGPLVETLEGAARPGHFEGVATVVTKLLVTARPERAYFGHKDAQQCAVVRRLAADLDTGTEIVVCPTVRDLDGLALSSRNARLEPAERRQALAIPAALAAADEAFRLGVRDPGAIRELVLRHLAGSGGLAVDYVAVVDAETFAPVTDMNVRCEILIAARIGGTRLIDVLTPGTDERLAVGAGE